MTEEFPIIYCSCGKMLSVQLNPTKDPDSQNYSFILSCPKCRDTPQLTEKNVNTIYTFLMNQQISDLIIPFDHGTIIDEPFTKLGDH